MSNADRENPSPRLPPIGFEGVANEDVKPLKKRKRSKKFKKVALASQSFNSGGPRLAEYSEPQFYQGRQRSNTEPGRRVHGTPIIESPPVDETDRGFYRYQGVGELRLRKPPGTARDESKRKHRFTISDLDGNEPTWLRERSIHKRPSMGVNTDVKDILRKLYNAEERERIDYVIAHRVPENPDSPEEKRKAKQRMRFEKLLEDEGFLLENETIGDMVFCKLHCKFPRLCKEAEGVKLQMPLKNMEIADDDEENCLTTCIDNTFATDDEVDFVSAPFEQIKLHLYENCENPDTFFRSSLRGLLTDHCLKNLDMRKLPNTPHYYYQHDDEDDPDPEEDILSKQGLPFLLMRGVYHDAFILHDESADNFKESQKFAEDEDDADDNPNSDDVANVIDVYGDARHDLNVSWPNVLKFQPLWKIRNYFGEEIALYFAWVGLLIVSIIIPMFIGLGVFGYGMYRSTQTQTNTTTDSTANVNATTESSTAELVSSALSLLNIFKEAFDNDSTPFYAVVICIWSTIFLELWKRKNAVLAYEWDVDDFEDVEPDRPEYFGTATRKDPITQEPIPFYPFKRKCLKYTVSFMTFLFMVCVVFIIVMSVIAYRVVMRVEYCPSFESSAYCFLVTTICSSLLNAIAIMILGKVYEVLAVKLTDWENHRTPSAYRNALIIKLFAFQFANCYSSLYYIAFFRSEGTFENGILNKGPEYVDSCGESCMPELSFQVLTLMVIKPLPRLLKDVILPWVKKKLKVCCKKSSTVDPEKSTSMDDQKSKFLETEKNKPPLKDFTLNEYTEKVIQYGFIVLFAAAMPLGPLIAVLVNTLDRVVDSKRILWMYRRPVSAIAQDIGMWQNILEFLNIAGVITNGFLIAYRSDWGKERFAGDELWAVLVFEHAVFLLKYALAIAIPDVPHRIRIAMRKEKFTVAKILETGMFVKDFGGPPANPNPMTPSHHRMTPEGERRTDSANLDTVTATNVTLDSGGPRQRNPRHRHAQDFTDAGGYIGDAENDSPRKATMHVAHASLAPQASPAPPIYSSTDPSTSRTPNSPPKNVRLEYGPSGNAFMEEW